VISWLLSLIGAASLVAAWWNPGSSLCVALGWTSIAFFSAGLRAPKRRVFRFFVAGVLTYIGGFYWLLNTIKDFGGFPTVAAIAIFLLYACGSSVQFMVWAFSYSYLPNIFARLGIRTAVAWLIAHHFWIKIFPWDFGHTQLGFSPLAQLAGVGGVSAISFLMFWVVEVLSERRNVALLARLVAFASFAGALAYGFWIQEALTKYPGSTLSTVMIQGNVSLQHKHDMTYFTVNREQYLKTSAVVAQKDSLVIWPESTITEFIPATTSDATQVQILPFLNNGSAFLVGGLTYLSKEQYFNSSLLIRPDGTVDTPYHKMILMPFGEYTPFAKWLPWLEEINSTAGQFSAGSAPRVLSFKLSTGKEAKLAPLICYEDVVPLLAREATARGAEVLINQTNDAWFGNTVAPYQHHMIASFRAIENRRFLLRSTNTGVTAVVDPLGRTQASLLPYTESVLPMEITLLDYPSTFTALPIYLIWLLLSAFAAFLVVYRRATQGQNPL
jgi:apolipoprotein N-acyltransferase